MENNQNASQGNLTDDEVIDLFIDGIIEEKGIKAPTDEIRQAHHDELKNQLVTEIERSLVGELPDEKLDELNQKVSADGKLDPAVVVEAIKEANLDTTEIIGVTMERFRELYLGQAKNDDEEA